MDETAPFLERGYRSNNNRKAVIAVLAVLCILFVAGGSVAAFLWYKTDAKLHDCEDRCPLVTSSTTLPIGTTGGTSASESTTTVTTTTTASTTATPIAPTPAPTPAPTQPQPPAAWAAIAESVLSSMNFSVDPCEDFYQFSCGGWLAANSIPSDRSSWARSFGVLSNETEQIELAIDAAQFPLIGLFYSACLDLPSIDARGGAPLSSLLSVIGGVQNVATLTDALLLMWIDGDDALLNFGPAADDKNPVETVAAFDQGGLTLPEVGYYFGNDSASVGGRAALLDFASALFALLPAPFNATPAASAQSVLAIETALANISMSNVARRNPEAVYNMIGLDALQNLTASIDFRRFLTGVGVNMNTLNTSWVNVQSLPFYTQLDSVVQPLLAANDSALVNYLAFHLAAENAGLLSAAFRNASFAFSQAISGVPALPARSVQCVRSIDGTELGFAVGHQFVAEYFQQSVKTAAQSLVDGIETAFGVRLHELDWLDNATLAAALEKLSEVRNKIGYPDLWPQYEGVALGNAHFDNVHSLAQYSRAKQAARVGLPTDYSRWDMLPQQINAYYDPTFNQMVFPAAILRGSFYDVEAPGALNYGGIGGVIGHELSHGFDDQGRQYDGKGRLRPWWSANVTAEFEARAQCVVELYSNFTIVAGNETLHVNGELTLGENLADLGGIANAYRAYVARLAVDHAFAAQEALVPLAFANLTAEQLYFVAWGQNWCTLRRPASAAQQIKTDPHSPAEIRVLGPVSQTAEFAAAYMCTKRTKYNPDPASVCHVW